MEKMEGGIELSDLGLLRMLCAIVAAEAAVGVGVRMG